MVSVLHSVASHDDPEQTLQAQVRASLANILRGVIAQKLVVQKDGQGRIPRKRLNVDGPDRSAIELENYGAGLLDNREFARTRLWRRNRELKKGIKPARRIENVAADYVGFTVAYRLSGAVTWPRDSAKSPSATASG